MEKLKSFWQANKQQNPPYGGVWFFFSRFEKKNAVGIPEGRFLVVGTACEGFLQVQVQPSVGKHSPYRAELDSLPTAAVLTVGMHRY